MASLGLSAHEIGSLKECNKILAKLGPESMKDKDRITVVKKPNQETRVEKHNVQVKSFSGKSISLPRLYVLWVAFRLD